MSGCTQPQTFLEFCHEYVWPNHSAAKEIFLHSFLCVKGGMLRGSIPGPTYKGRQTARRRGTCGEGKLAFLLVGGESYSLCHG